jgi:limonene-1,2-epoxide hydrolase
VRIFEIGGRKFVFLSKETGTGRAGKNAHIHPLKADGTLGARIYEKRWSEGWTSTEFYSVGGQTYMIRLKKSGNGDSGYNVHVDRIKADGTVGSRVKSYKWTEGWTTVRTFPVAGNQYLFLLKERGTGRTGKNVHIHAINADGTIGQRIYERKWSEGWTAGEFYRCGNQTFFMRLKARGFGDSGNNVHINRVNANGTIGPRVKSYKWSEGWTNVRAFQLRGSTYLTLLKKSDYGSSGNNFHVHKINTDGSIGARVIEQRLDQGWTTLEPYDVRGQQYLMRLMRSGNPGSGRNVYVMRVQ